MRDGILSRRGRRELPGDLMEGKLPAIPGVACQPLPDWANQRLDRVSRSALKAVLEMRGAEAGPARPSRRHARPSGPGCSYDQGGAF